MLRWELGRPAEPIAELWNGRRGALIASLPQHTEEARVRGGSGFRRPRRLEQAANQSALQRREPCLLSSCSTPPAARARRRRCPAFTPAGPAEQGPALSGGPADGRGDHRGDAPGRRRSSRSAHPRADRGAVACRAADQRGARADRDRSRQRRGSILVRHGKGDRRREVGMDAWAWRHSAEWLADRIALPVGAAVLRDRRADPRPRLVGHRGPRRAAPSRRRRPGSAAGSRPTSSAMPTLSRWTERNPELPQRSRAGR